MKRVATILVSCFIAAYALAEDDMLLNMLSVAIFGSGAEPPWTPASGDGEIEGWWSFGDEGGWVATNDTLLAQWTDLSGKGRHFIRAGGSGSNPVLTTTNGFRGARLVFNSTDFFAIPNSTGTFNFVHFGTRTLIGIAVRADSAGNQQNIILGNSNQASNQRGFALTLDSRAAFSRTNALNLTHSRAVSGQYTYLLITNNVAPPGLFLATWLSQPTNTTESLIFKIDGRDEFIRARDYAPATTGDAFRNLSVGNHNAAVTLSAFEGVIHEVFIIREPSDADISEARAYLERWK